MEGGSGRTLPAHLEGGNGRALPAHMEVVVGQHHQYLWKALAKRDFMGFLPPQIWCQTIVFPKNILCQYIADYKTFITNLPSA